MPSPNLVQFGLLNSEQLNSTSNQIRDCIRCRIWNMTAVGVDVWKLTWSQRSIGDNILSRKLLMSNFTFGPCQCLVASCMHVYYTVKSDMDNHSLGSGRSESWKRRVMSQCLEIGHAMFVSLSVVRCLISFSVCKNTRQRFDTLRCRYSTTLTNSGLDSCRRQYSLIFFVFVPAFSARLCTCVILLADSAWSTR